MKLDPRSRTYFTTVLILNILISFLVQHEANAASPKLNSSQCRQAIASFQGLYDPAGGLKVAGYEPDPVTGQSVEFKPPISKLVSSRKTWKSLESNLASGSAKSGFQVLIEEAYTIITTGSGGGNEGRVSMLWNLAITDITKGCLPPESNEFCRTIGTAFTGVSNLWNGQTISKSGVLNTKRIWSNEVKKWPAQSNSRAWMKRLLAYIDEMISEAKAKRSTMAAYSLFLDEWGNLDSNNDVVDYWPCRDRVADALGTPYLK